MKSKLVWGHNVLENSLARTLIFQLIRCDSSVNSLEDLSVAEQVAYITAVAVANGSVGLMQNYSTAIDSILSNERLVTENKALCMDLLDKIIVERQFVEFVSRSGFESVKAEASVRKLRTELSKPTLKKRPKNLTKSEVREIIWEEGAGNNDYFDSHLSVSSITPADATKLSRLTQKMSITSLGIRPKEDARDKAALNLTTKILIENYFETLKAFELGVTNASPTMDLTEFAIDNSLLAHWKALNLTSFICNDVSVPREVIESILKPSLVRLTVNSANFPTCLFETVVEKCPNLNIFVAPTNLREWSTEKVKAAKKLQKRLNCYVSVNGVEM